MVFINQITQTLLRHVCNLLEAIIWTILMPWEPPKSSVPIRTITPSVRPPKKAAKKSSSKKAATKKSATKKTEKSKGKATTKAKKK